MELVSRGDIVAHRLRNTFIIRGIKITVIRVVPYHSLFPGIAKGASQFMSWLEVR